MTIWLFHSGMVFIIELWIFSTRSWSPFWMRRTWGAVWMLTMRVSLRSYSFLSKRSRNWLKSWRRCASIGSLVAWAFAWISGRVFSRSSASFHPPGRDIDVELLEVFEVLRVQPVEQGDVLQEGHAGGLELVDDLLDLDAELLVAGDEALEGPREPADEAPEEPPCR